MLRSHTPPRRHSAPLTMLIVLTCITLISCASAPKQSQGRSISAANAGTTTPVARFNPYILRAVEMLAADRGGLGYGNHAFTRDLQFGNQGTLNASPGKPLTMCVAAQFEVLVEALNLYAAETNDFDAFTFLPRKSWERLRPTDLRGQIWLVEGANSSGAADALKNLGMGAKTTFESMLPGDFLNFNRTNGSGHGVIFLAYLDGSGNELAAHSDQVAGFRYFSSQGKADTGGLGYRYAFFHPHCPTLPAGRKRDCGVILSPQQRLLNTGYAMMPTSWRASRVIGAAAAAAAGTEGTFDSAYFNGSTTDD